MPTASVSQATWFVAIDGHVSGPMTVAEVEKLNDQNRNATLLVWGKGMKQWLSHAEWTERLNAAPVGLSEDQVWFLTNKGSSFGPFSYSELLVKLAKIGDDCKFVLLRSSENGVWLGLSNFPKILRELNLSRLFHRASLMGEVEVMTRNRVTHARLKDISETGVGVIGLDAAVAGGEKVALKIMSSNLPQGIVASAQIVFRGEGGEAGFCFLDLPPEMRVVIVEYVKAYERARAKVVEMKSGRRNQQVA